MKKFEHPVISIVDGDIFNIGLKCLGVLTTNGITILAPEVSALSHELDKLSKEDGENS